MILVLTCLRKVVRVSVPWKAWLGGAALAGKAKALSLTGALPWVVVVERSVTVSNVRLTLPLPVKGSPVTVATSGVGVKEGVKVGVGVLVKVGVFVGVLLGVGVLTGVFVGVGVLDGVGV